MPDDSTDFLILYDHAPLGLRPALLDAFFEHPGDRRAFELILQDPVLRARMELEFNQSLSFADHLLLRGKGYVRSEPFRSRSVCAYGQEFLGIMATDRHRAEEIALPGVNDPCGFFAPFVEAYVARSTGIGIVLGRDTLEVALDLGDRAVLALAVDPDSGRPALEDGLPEQPRGDIRARRRGMLGWWSIPGRGVELHDLDRDEIPNATPRGLACDAAALEVLRQARR